MWPEWKAAVWGRCWLLRARAGSLWKSQGMCIHSQPMGWSKRGIRCEIRIRWQAADEEIWDQIPSPWHSLSVSLALALLYIWYPDPQWSDSHPVKALLCVKYEWWDFYSANGCMMSVCMFTCTRVHGVINPCMNMQRSEQNIVFPYGFQSYYLETGWPLNRKLSVSARLVDQ